MGWLLWLFVCLLFVLNWFGCYWVCVLLCWFAGLRVWFCLYINVYFLLCLWVCGWFDELASLRSLFVLLVISASLICGCWLFWFVTEWCFVVVLGLFVCSWRIVRFSFGNSVVMIIASVFTMRWVWWVLYVYLLVLFVFVVCCFFCCLVCCI